MTLPGAPHRVQLSDAELVAIALGIVVGAFLPMRLPVVVLALLVAASALLRVRLALALLLVLLSSGLAYRAHSGLIVETGGAVDGEVILMRDPRTFGNAVYVDVRYDSKRYEIAANGWTANRLAGAEMGDKVDLVGVIQDGSPEPRWIPRHVVARMQVSWVGEIRPATGLIGISNRVRAVLASGLEGLPAQERSLILGFVIGDDREQPAALREDFRASGLTHLQAVSGQNVAFVLAVLAPLVSRLDRRLGLIVIAVALLLFGTVTRWEPSVMRATVMVGFAVVARVSGRALSGIRALSLAVGVLVLVDPLLVWSVGFGLSVGASGGILLLSRPISRRLRGPTWLRNAFAITLSAQLGVSPLLIAVFDGVPLVAIPANLVAVPAAGPVMVWGVTAGFVAGALGGFWAEVIHFPNRILVDWVATVARISAGAGLPMVGWPGLGVALVLLGITWR
ncbi:MAG: ComEC/Rec2 family competence protein [Acidimicrobiales bacterium]